MNMNESSGRIPGLRSKGWSGAEIAGIILRDGTGDGKYRPKPENAQGRE